MAGIIEEFYLELYEEHLERASSSYERQQYAFDDNEFFWLDTADYQKHFELHFHALIVGKNPAIEVCREQAVKGDFGELHTAVSVFCRQNHQELVEALIEELNFDDDERVKAVTDALCHELPESWHQSLIPLLFEKSPETACMAANIIAFQRLPMEHMLIATINRFPSEKNVVLSVLFALNRLRSEAAIPIAKSFLASEIPEIVQAAVFLLIRTEAKAYAMTVNKEQWSPVDRGLSGDKNEFKHGEDFDSKNCLAMGLIGSIEAIPDLIKTLSNNSTANDASLALNLITGAGLYEEVFIPEEIDEDTLFEDELKKYKKGELFAPGEEPGETITRLSQNPETWQNWWNENNQNFDPTIRYRNGKPYSPECLIENLKSEKSPDIVRKLAYEELVIRYNIDFPFETEMPVKQQISVIEKYENRFKANPDKFENGKWYFHGELI